MKVNKAVEDQHNELQIVPWEGGRSGHLFQSSKVAELDLDLLTLAPTIDAEIDSEAFNLNSAELCLIDDLVSLHSMHGNNNHFSSSTNYLGSPIFACFNYVQQGGHALIGTTVTSSFLVQSCSMPGLWCLIIC